jgi:hypothetical protein
MGSSPSTSDARERRPPAGGFGLARYAHRAITLNVVRHISVQRLAHETPVVAERPEERKEHVPPFCQSEALVLKVVDAAQVVRCDVLLRRARVSSDATAAELVGVLV